MRVFTYHDEQWRAEPRGMGHGVGSIGPGDTLPPITSWTAVFRRLSDDSVRVGELRTQAVEELSEDELRGALEQAIRTQN